MPSWKVILQFSWEKNDSDQQQKNKDWNALERAKWRQNLKNAFFLFLIDLPDNSSFKLVGSFSYLYYLFENFV